MTDHVGHVAQVHGCLCPGEARPDQWPRPRRHQVSDHHQHNHDHRHHWDHQGHHDNNVHLNLQRGRDGQWPLRLLVQRPTRQQLPYRRWLSQVKIDLLQKTFIDILSFSGVRLPTKLPTTRRSTATGKTEEKRILTEPALQQYNVSGATSLRSTSLRWRPGRRGKDNALRFPSSLNLPAMRWVQTTF